MSKVTRRACCSQYSSNPQELTVLNEPNQKKYSRIICAYCGHWLRWGMSPKTAEQISTRQRIINLLLTDDRDCLSNVDYEFLDNIKDQKYITPKQHFRYNLIFDQVMRNLGKTGHPKDVSDE